MPDSKITALTSIGASTDPANDPLVLVDVSDTSMAASGTTKKVTLNQLLGASGTATLASATISGDLTVDTSTLKVDSANNRVGIGTASPHELLVTANTGGNVIHSILTSASGTGNIFFATATAGVNSYRGYLQYDQSLNALAFGINSSTAMTLNSTGLGVGGSPAYKLDVNSGATASAANFKSTGSSVITRFADGTADTGYVGSGAALIAGGARTDFGILSVGSLILGSNNARSVTVDTSGNVGVGVTPSAWASTYRALQIGLGTSLIGITNDVDVNLTNNARFDGTNWKYLASSPAERYRTAAGTHYWYNAASGTAGNNITWTQAMTLDASGNLLIKKTSASGTTLGVELLATGQINGATAGADNLNIYNTTAAAYRFYVSAAGTIFATNTTISAISDARFKENVEDIDVGLGAILALKPRKFDWKDGKGKNIKGDRGFIAQEFETVFPNLIDEWKDNAPEGEAPYKSVRQDLIPVLVKAIQELAAEVNALKNA